LSGYRIEVTDLSVSKSRLAEDAELILRLKGRRGVLKLFISTNDAQDEAEMQTLLARD